MTLQFAGFLVKNRISKLAYDIYILHSCNVTFVNDVQNDELKYIGCLKNFLKITNVFLCVQMFLVLHTK